MEEKRLMDYCKKLPKAELHAHLNGSISNDTMRALIYKKSQLSNSDATPQKLKTVIAEEGQILDDAFELFKIIHSIVDCEEAIVQAACDVVKDFSDDNVKYLELRTTPRANIDTGMTKRSYIDAVLRGIQQALPFCSNDMKIRLLLSIDRRQPISEAFDTVSLACEYRTIETQGNVVGIDLSGEPNAGNTYDIVSVLEKAKHEGLKLAVHIAERPNRDSDTEMLLTVSPDRLGHATFLHSPTLVQAVLDKKIPIELCLTSNVKAKTVESYDQHHLKFWREKNHPYIICTDDKGVFATSLSNEYYIAATTFSLNEPQLQKLSQDSFLFAFDYYS